MIAQNKNGGYGWMILYREPMESVGFCYDDVDKFEDI